MAGTIIRWREERGDVHDPSVREVRERDAALFGPELHGWRTDRLGFERGEGRHGANVLGRGVSEARARKAERTKAGSPDLPRRSTAIRNDEKTAECYNPRSMTAGLSTPGSKRTVTPGLPGRLCRAGSEKAATEKVIRTFGCPFASGFSSSSRG